MRAEPAPGALDSPLPRSRGAASRKRLGCGQGLVAFKVWLFPALASSVFLPSVFTSPLFRWGRAAVLGFYFPPSWIRLVSGVYAKLFQRQEHGFLRAQDTNDTQIRTVFVLPLTATAEYPEIHSFFPREGLQQTNGHICGTVTEQGVWSPQGWEGATA